MGGGPTTAYTNEAFTEIITEMRGANTDIDTALTELEGFVEGQMADWIGESREQYRLHKAEWDKAIVAMNSILTNNAIPTVNNIQLSYNSNEKHMTSQWL